jgi:hypothetical protein
MRGLVHERSDVEAVRTLLAAGYSEYAVALQTGVPRSTVNYWRHHGPPARSEPRCPACNGSVHRFDQLEARPYAYLLGQYLGDGSIHRAGGSMALRIAGDAQYGGIIEECCTAIERLRGRRPYVRYHQDKRLASIVSYWKSWPCLFPQHGPGRKHTRVIELVAWQESILDAEPGPFLRGLVHSDGWRGVNRVRVGGRHYAYPRYQFSNRSADIKRLFTEACDHLGIAWRPWGPHNVSVARRESVALLDQFVGLKR